MARHVAHLAVSAGGKPCLKAALVGAKLDRANANLLKAETGSPILDVAAKLGEVD
jgi:hypothetical protein